MSPRTPKNVVAVTPGGSITLDMILGHYALFQVPDAPVSAAKLRRLWMAEGLEEKLVPKQRKAVHAFQAACRSVETRRTVHNGTTKHHEVKVDEVLEDADECVYQITRLVRDKDLKVIDHPKAMTITFNKADESIKDKPLDRATYTELQDLTEQIRNDFEKNSSKVPGAKVRAAIRATLGEQHATNVQNKGVYFVLKQGKSTLDSIGHVLTGLYGEGGGAEMHLIPCANDDGQKALIAKHFTVNVTDNIDKMLAEVSQRLREGTGARKDRRENLVGDRRRLSGAVEQYRLTLDTKLDLVDEKMKLLDDALEELLTQ